MNKKNNLKLIKSHISSITNILSRYSYEGEYPNTQAGNIKSSRVAIAELEYHLRSAICEEDKSNE